jgi:transcriptional regulator of acetoin/glycerol metabolism
MTALAHEPVAGRSTFTAISAAFEALGQAVALVDDELRLVDVSPSFRGIFGTPDVTGRLITEFLHGAELEEALRSGRPGMTRCELMTSAPSRTILVKSGRIADGAGPAGHNYVIAIDIDSASHDAAGTAAEAQEILRALEANRWRRTAAARSLGISRATLWRRMREFGML